jgi:3-methyl-2-oxobutanoate hydroxymethyltransferase
MSQEKKHSKITVPDITAMKASGEKISMLTAYDALMAEILDIAGLDIILVGDSGAMVYAGRENTLSITMDEMIFYTKSVRQGVHNALLIADMPYLSYQISTEKALENAGRFLKEAGAEGVKIEGGQPIASTIKKIVDIGIPVMGHLGLTPQSIHALGGYKLQGTEKIDAERLLNDAKILEQAGVFSIVLEKIPAGLAKRITSSVNIPTIGIGAGADCDGQVLVTQDLLGMYRKFKPKFVRRYADIGDKIEKACKNYISDVKSSRFPSDDESF